MHHNTPRKHDSQSPDCPGAAANDDSTGVACPFCGSRETELVSLFGGQLSTDQYYCRACHSYFERFTRDAEDARG